MHLLLTSTAAFLELVQAASRKFSVLLSQRARYHDLRADSTGYSLGSGCLAWEMVSTLLRISVFAFGIARVRRRHRGVPITMNGELHSGRHLERTSRRK